MRQIFDHFIITRFNLRQSIWKKDKNQVQVNNSAWLEERYALFNTYCLPSIQNQTNQNFKWLVFFDSKTVLSYKNKNTILHEKYPNFIPVYVDSFELFGISVPKVVEHYRDKDKSFVITTRLDNDDCFHQEAVAVIQKHFIIKPMTILDLCNGLCLEIRNKKKLSIKKNITYGPFISLIEKAKKGDSFLTVYSREHSRWEEVAYYIPISLGYYWMQIIHKRNVINELSKDLTCNKVYLKGFEFIGNLKFSLRYCIFIYLKRIKQYFRDFKQQVT
ncbi:glycosyltransferase [Aestuariivivens sediminicola]|uniref:glycosyltransferase n=1 Tax=Aestuariivivens sediminicola TaxID=2913560 RepID=UPI001F578FB5|nr:glycosyltransferase [Aestuariivivens sediminicola]